MASTEKSGKSTVRHIRVPDELWIAAATRAESDGGISYVTRELLRRYAAGEIDLAA